MGSPIAITLTPSSDYDDDSNYSTPYLIPKGMPVNLSALVPLSAILLPALSPNASPKSFLLQTIAEKRDDKSLFFKKFRVRHVALTRSKLLIYHVMNKGVPTNSNQEIIAMNNQCMDTEKLPSDKDLIEEMNLDGVCVSKLKDKNGDLGIVLSENDGFGKRKWILQFDNEVERNNWMYTIKFCMFLM